MISTNVPIALIIPPSIDSKLAWEASEIDDILDDALHYQEIDRSPPTVNAVRNLRYKPGKRAKMNDETASQKAPSLPSEIDLDKFKESLLTDKFASTMLAYLDHETLPENVTLARDIVLQSDQYFSLNGLTSVSNVHMTASVKDISGRACTEI